METQSPSPKRGRTLPPIFGPCLLWPNGWMDQDATFGTKVGLSTGDSVLDRDQPPSPQRGVEPPAQFSAHFYCGQTAGCIKMPLDMEVGLSTGDYGLDGDPLPKARRRLGQRCPNFCPWIFTWHGGRPLSSPHCARWRHSSPHQNRGQSPPNFRPILLWPNGWMHQDATWCGGRPRPTRHCVRRGPS